MAHNLSRTSLESGYSVQQKTESRSTDFLSQNKTRTQAVLPPADSLMPPSDPVAPQFELSATQPTFTGIWLALSVNSTKESSGQSNVVEGGAADE